MSIKIVHINGKKFIKTQKFIINFDSVDFFYVNRYYLKGIERCSIYANINKKDILLQDIRTELRDEELLEDFLESLDNNKKEI